MSRLSFSKSRTKVYAVQMALKKVFKTLRVTKSDLQSSYLVKSVAPRNQIAVPKKSYAKRASNQASEGPIQRWVKILSSRTLMNELSK